MIRFILLILLGVTGSACGYSTRPLYDPDIKSVAVDVFKNETFRRGLEIELTRKVAEQIRLRTPWRVANRGSADAALTGKIVDVREVILSKDQDDRTQESSVIVTVEATLTDLSTDKLIKQVRRTSSTSFFVALGGKETAFTRSLANLAEDVVQGLEEWY